jgi:hypothetical protein
MWTKLKGFLGLGTVGAGVGALFGAGWIAISGLVTGAFSPDAVLNAAVVYGSFGFFTTAGLSLVLANARSKASLDDISVVWAALIGAAAGAAFPLIINIVMLQSLLPLRLITGFLPIMATLGLFGGALTAGMITVAKHQHLELDAGSEAELLEE